MLKIRFSLYVTLMEMYKQIVLILFGGVKDADYFDPSMIGLIHFSKLNYTKFPVPYFIYETSKTALTKFYLSSISFLQYYFIKIINTYDKKYKLFSTTFEHPYVDFYDKTGTIQEIVKYRFPFVMKKMGDKPIIQIDMSKIKIRNNIKYQPYSNIYIDENTSLSSVDQYKFVTSLNALVSNFHLYTHVCVGYKNYLFIRSLSTKNELKKFWNGLTLNTLSAGRIGAEEHYSDNDSPDFELVQIKPEDGIEYISKNNMIDLWEKQTFESSNKYYNTDGEILYDAFWKAINKIYDVLSTNDKNDLLHLDILEPLQNHERKEKLLIYMTNLIWYDSVMHYIYHHPIELMNDAHLGSFAIYKGNNLKEITSKNEDIFRKYDFLRNTNYPMQKSILNYGFTTKLDKIFVEEIKNAENLISNNNKTRSKPYNLFLPSKIPLSTSI